MQAMIWRVREALVREKNGPVSWVDRQQPVIEQGMQVFAKQQPVGRMIMGLVVERVDVCSVQRFRDITTSYATPTAVGEH